MKTIRQVLSLSAWLTLMAMTVSAQNAGGPVSHGSLSELNLKSTVYLQINDEDIRRSIAREILTQTGGKLIPRDAYSGSDFAIAFIKCYRQKASEDVGNDSATLAEASPCLLRGWPSADPSGQMFAYKRDKSGRFRILWTDKKGENRPLEAIKDFLKEFSKNCQPIENLDYEKNFDDVVTMEMADTRPKILYRERARFTEEARMHHVSGEVVLSAIFRTDGRISDIRVVKGLAHGLTESSIESARRTRFEPATLNGKPVSVIGEIRYRFAIY